MITLKKKKKKKKKKIKKKKKKKKKKKSKLTKNELLYINKFCRVLILLFYYIIYNLFLQCSHKIMPVRWKNMWFILFILEQAT